MPGKRTTIGGDSLVKQMARMAAWGEFGDDVANSFMDGERYHYIQDRLLGWPDQDAIRNEGLHRFEPVRPNRDVK